MLRSDLERLKEIREEMNSLLDEATQLLKKSATSIAYQRAASYWLAQVRIELNIEHDYLARSMCCMEDTINDLEEEVEEDGVEEEEPEEDEAEEDGDEEVTDEAKDC